MRTLVKLRTLTSEEVTEIKRLASSRKESIRLVQPGTASSHHCEHVGGQDSLCHRRPQKQV